MCDRWHSSHVAAGHEFQPCCDCRDCVKLQYTGTTVWVSARALTQCIQGLASSPSTTPQKLWQNICSDTTVRELNLLHDSGNEGCICVQAGKGLGCVRHHSSEFANRNKTLLDASVCELDCLKTTALVS